MIEIADYKVPTFSDYPGKVTMTVYLQGCNKNCTYCFNKHLIPVVPGTIPVEYLMSRLATMVGCIDAVVFTGGEPSIHGGLPQIMKEVSEMGFKVGMHTNGTGKYIKECVEQCDYILFSGTGNLEHENVDKITVIDKL